MAVESMKEALTGYMGVVSSDHAYIHKGLAYTAIINTGSISAAYDIAFTTPDEASGIFVHWRPIGATSSANYVDIKLYEGDSFSGGSAVTPINRNRESLHTTNMQAFVSNATATPTGTILSSLGVGTSGLLGGVAAPADQELLLKQNTNYVLTLTPAGATICNLELFWYEEGNGHS